MNKHDDLSFLLSFIYSTKICHMAFDRNKLPNIQAPKAFVLESIEKTNP